MRKIAASALTALIAATLAGCAGGGLQSVRPGMPVLAADKAQNRVAQDEGVLLALAQTAAPGAVVFAPGPEDAQKWLSAQGDFPSTQWSAHQVLVSCDGTMGVVTGAIQWGESPGYYTTVWRFRADEDGKGGTWRWVLSHGDAVETPRPAPQYPLTRAASCDDLPDGSGPATKAGQSADGSLRYRWDYAAGTGRQITVELWNGSEYKIALEDRVADGQSTP